MAGRGASYSEPMALADLRLPPNFVTDHCIRTLSYQGAMNTSELARHWRVHDSIATEVVNALKAAALVELESSQANFDRASRVRLTGAGQQRVSVARERTWYAGALPVSLAEFEQSMDLSGERLVRAGSIESRLSPLAVDPATAATVGQAIGASATIAIAGLAFDEQLPFALAIGEALAGEVRLPSALYAAGSVLRVYNPRLHRLARSEAKGSNADVLRSRDVPTQWVTVARPAVVVSGGIQPSDAVPAFDEEAKFYVAPLPFAASGGVLVVLDADSNAAGMTALARSWLMPGRYKTGVLQLRSGERIEVPWHSSTVLLGAGVPALPASLAASIPYAIDIGELDDSSLRNSLSRRLPDRALVPAPIIDALAGMLEQRGRATRTACAQAALHLTNRASYEGPAFAADEEAARRAADFAAAASSAGPALLRAIA